MLILNCKLLWVLNYYHAMKKQEHLYFLIHSLSPAEKRYFKIFSNIHGKEKKTYLLLFDSLSKAKEYNEEAIKEKFSKKGFINNFHVIKKELFDLILKSLVNYHAANNAKIEILHLFHQIHILKEKGLETIAAPLIAKATLLAKQFHHHALLLEAYILQSVNISSNNLQTTTYEAIDDLFKKRNSLLEALFEENNIDEGLKRLQFQFVDNKKIIKTKNIQQIVTIENVLALDEADLKSFKSKIDFFRFNFLYHYKNGDIKSSAVYTEKLLMLLEENKQLNKEYLITYLQGIYNASAIYLALKKFGKTEVIIDKLKSIESKEPRIMLNVFTIRHIILSAVYIATKQFHKVTSMEDEILQGLKCFNNKISIKDFQALHFNLASSFFMLNNYGKSILHLNTLLNKPKETLNKDIYTISELLFILAHFELENYDLVLSLIKTAKKNFDTYNVDWDIEKLAFQFLLFAIETEEKNAVTKEIKKLKTNTKKLLSTKPSNYKDSNYNYLLDWINEKLKP
jgi:hypothetical protein